MQGNETLSKIFTRRANGVGRRDFVEKKIASHAKNAKDAAVQTESRPNPSGVRDESNAPFFGKQNALRLGAIALIGLTAVAGVCAYDHAHRGSLETVDAPTAVGDTHFVSPANAQQPITTWKGRELFGADRIKTRDSQMLRVAMDDTGAFSIYQATEPIKESEQKPPAGYFLKTANEEYVAVKMKN